MAFATSLLLLLFFSVPPISIAAPISLSLDPILPPASATDDPYLLLTSLATFSLQRAGYLRHPPAPLDPSSSSLYAQLPLSPHSYGGYTLPLSLGSPPQSLPLLLDTASHLVWLPCTRSYSCQDCSQLGSSPLLFLPKSSSSSRLVGCRNPKCLWIHSANAVSACNNCSDADTDCPRVCPPYLIMYASGSTGGVLLSETLQIPGLPQLSDFAVGCSVFSSRQPPAGVAGFGRGPASLPAQLHLRRFSYCLVSRSYDDIPGKAGAVILDGSEPSRGELNSTKFMKNPPGSPYDVYYYVTLKKIVVGGSKVRMPRRLLEPGAGGNGGTIVDSGSTFTFMERDVFEAVETAVVGAVAGRYNRSAEAETKTGLGLCFSVSEEEVMLPPVELHFKGGAVLAPPLRNWFAVVGKTGAACLMVVSGDEGTVTVGPSVILGGFQQQNHRMVFDLERERLGFHQQQCLES